MSILHIVICAKTNDFFWQETEQYQKNVQRAQASKWILLTLQ